MANFNQSVLMGHMVADAELHYTDGGTAIANFTIAVNSKYGEREETLFMPCVAFGKITDIIVKYTNKGKNVMVTGRLVEERWETEEGNKRSRMKLYVDRLQLLGGGNKNATDDEGDF